MVFSFVDPLPRIPSPLTPQLFVADADILEVGNPGLSFEEQKAHMAAWVIMCSPLLISTDLVSGIDNETMFILSAPEVLAITQDPLGIQGIRVTPANSTGSECWSRPLSDGSVVALFLNRGTLPTTITCTYAELGLKNPSGSGKVRDLWARQDLGSFTASYSTNVGAQAGVFVKVSQ